jgi:hypothetical protein
MKSRKVLFSLFNGLILLALLAGAVSPGSVWAARPAGIEATGFALQFDGANDYVTFGQAASLGLAQFTLEGWIKRTGNGATTTTGTGGVTAVPLITKGRGEGDNSNLDMNYFLGIQASTNYLCADFEEGAGGSTPGLNHPICGSTAIPANSVWRHVAATYSGTSWALYLDGAAQGTLSVGQPLRSDSIQHAGIATAMTSTGAPAGFFTGVMEEVRIWNRALTQAEIQGNMYQAMTSGSGLVARWGLDDGTGTTADDAVGTANGTLTSGPL